MAFQDALGLGADALEFDVHAGGTLRLMNLRHALDLTAPPVGYHRFCDDVSINFQCNRWVQWIGSHGVEPLMAVSRRPSTYSAWIDTFLSLGAEAREDGRALDAAYFERGAEFFMEPTDPRKAPTRSHIVTTLQRAFDVTPVAVPYANASLPAYDLRPNGTPNGTLVVFGGFDSYVEEWFPMVAAMVAHGRRVVAFDGPGQGGALEENHLPMTADWERPLGAVLDHFALDDVTLVGGSLGGCLVVRAAASEPRAKRVVAFDVLDDFIEALLQQTPIRDSRAARLLLRKGPSRAIDAIIGRITAREPVRKWGLWQGMHVTGTRTPAEFLRAGSRFVTSDVSSRVRGDVLLMQGADDHYVPSQQLYRQAKSLTSARSITTRVFTAAESASNHCQIGNIGLAVQTMLAWEDGLSARKTLG